MLASVADITAGHDEQTLRILRDADPANPVSSLTQVRPRLDKAETWITKYVPAESRTIVRDVPDTELLGSIDESQRSSLQLLLDGLDGNWSLSGLTTLVYAVPKIQAGLPLDVKPTPELKATQRSFFALLYQLLVGRDTGPRLPTLLLAVGAERVRKLLAP
jgi:lysyl-tRNA synthetase class 1